MLQPLVCIHAHVVVGARNDELVGLQVLVEDHLPSIRTLDPKVLRHVPLGREQTTDLRTDVVDPVHALCSSGSTPDRGGHPYYRAPRWPRSYPLEADLAPASSGAQCSGQAFYQI